MPKTHITVRLPDDAKRFIEREANRNASSQNSEIVRCIRAAMEATGATPGSTTPATQP